MTSRTTDANLPERFWRKVQKGETCWLWTGALRSHGYGEVQINKRKYAAHRIAWTMNFGPIPKGSEVCHTCDNPPCVRLDHLFLGTHAENMADMSRKGRAVSPRLSGVRHPMAKLTDSDVNEMRRLAAGGMGAPAIARRYGMSESHTYQILSGRKWRAA